MNILNSRREAPLTPKIALFLPSLNGGGAERVLINLSTAFAEKGIEVDLLVGNADGPFIHDVSNAVRLVDFKVKRIIATVLPLTRYLRNEQPKALLSTMGHANVVALISKYLAHASIPVVVREANTITVNTEHAGIKERLLSALVRRTYRFADSIVVNSAGSGADLAKFLKLDRRRILTIPNPVSPTVLAKSARADVDHPWFREDQPPVILGVGRLCPQKDFATLLRAFRLVRNKQIARLVILGEGEERASLSNLAHQLRIEDDVYMPGFVKNPFSFIRRSAVFVLSSRWEGSPNVLVEALALGAPVVSTDCRSGPAEILGKASPWLVSVGNAPKMASVILERLNSHSGIDVDLTEYMLERVAERYLELMTKPR